jgi:hypothetical protein
VIAKQNLPVGLRVIAHETHQDRTLSGNVQQSVDKDSSVFHQPVTHFWTDIETHDMTIFRNKIPAPP